MQITTLRGLSAAVLTQIVITGKHRLRLHGMLPLAACVALQRISVTWLSTHARPQRSRTTAAQLLQALSTLTALTELRLQGSSGPLRVFPDRLGALARLLKKLPTAATARRWQTVTPITGLAPAAPRLLQLSLTGCKALRDQDLAMVAASPLADHLTLLSLSGCVQITGRGFDSVASLRALRRLDLSQYAPNSCSRTKRLPNIEMCACHLGSGHLNPVLMQMIQYLLLLQCTSAVMPTFHSEINVAPASFKPAYPRFCVSCTYASVKQNLQMTPTKSFLQMPQLVGCGNAQVDENPSTSRKGVCCSLARPSIPSEVRADIHRCCHAGRRLPQA